MHARTAGRLILALAAIAVLSNAWPTADADRALKRGQVAADESAPCPCEDGDAAAGSSRVHQTALQKADKQSPKRSGCVCIKFWFADLGESEVYYAHEYDECIEELCPYPNYVYYTGNDLEVDQECPDECLQKNQLRSRPAEQPKLDAPRPADFDIYAPGDPDVELNGDVRMWPKGDAIWNMKLRDGRVIPIKVFFTKVRSVSVTAMAAFGVETERAEDDAREVPGELVEGFEHLYRIPFHGPHSCFVITAQ